jgi:hypothetical protein
MAKDPDARPQSALAFARSLQEIEQEQRFSRTAIVVLDEQGQTTLADQSAPAPGADDDRTRVRAPQSVQGQAPAAPPRPPRSVGGTTAVTGAQGVAAAGTHATYERPAPDLPDAGGTVSRDRLGTRTPTQEPTAAPAAGRNPAVTLAAIAVVVVAVVFLASQLFGRGGAGEPSDTPKTVASQGDDLALDVPSTPTLEAVPVAGAVRFTWTYLAPEKADTFFVRTAGDTSGLGAAVGKGPLEDATYTVKAPRGKQVCAQVQVNRSGPTSEYSAATCGRAK